MKEENGSKSENVELIEHRCFCGRLLGKFSGRAEIKCPKCGKVNVIGSEKKWMTV